MLPRVVDLFCGAGGLALGFRAAGCIIDAAVDADEISGETLRRNLSLLQPEVHPRVLAGEEFDLTDLDLARITVTPPDILIGGPPCQGFSRLGRGKLDSLSDEGFEGDPRNELYRHFLDAVRFWRPRAVVMENVPGMLSVRGVNYAVIVEGELADEGYRVGYAQLNSVWYGVPQFRERLFFIGIREDLGIRPEAPRESHRAPLTEGYRRPLREQMRPLAFDLDWERLEGELAIGFDAAAIPAVTVKEALEDLPPIDNYLLDDIATRGDFRRQHDYQQLPQNAYGRLMRSWPGLAAPTVLLDHVTRRTPRDYETFGRMQPGDRYPQAVAIASKRFEEAIARLTLLGLAPETGSPEWKRIEEQFVPPYPLGSFDDRWRKLIPDQPSWTVPAHLAHDSYSHIHYDGAQARMISVREAARLQSFPDSFQFTGNMGECFRQIGNAVPPLLAWAIAHRLLCQLGHQATPPPWPVLRG